MTENETATEVLDTEASEMEVGEATPKANLPIDDNIPEGPEEALPYTDYESLAIADIEEIHKEFPESCHISGIHALDNPERFAELRDLGLSAKEAYLATQRPRRKTDNRAHLLGSVPRGAAAPSSSMTRSELDSVRDLFGSLNDTELQALYKRVTR